MRKAANLINLRLSCNYVRLYISFLSFQSSYILHSIKIFRTSVPTGPTPTYFFPNASQFLFSREYSIMFPIMIQMSYDFDCHIIYRVNNEYKLNEE